MMTKAEAAKWLESLKQEIGKTENYSLWHYVEAIDMVIEAISEPKTGRWIFNPENAIELMFTKPRCSECGFESSDGGNFCSNCGAMMRGKE